MPGNYISLCTLKSGYEIFLVHMSNIYFIPCINREIGKEGIHIFLKLFMINNSDLTSLTVPILYTVNWNAFHLQNYANFI
jgi:hypothetical protein